MCIYYDLKTFTDENTHLLFINPINNGIQPIASSVGISYLKGQGYLTSTSKVLDNGNRTRIDFSLKLNSVLPVPVGMRLMPRKTIQDLVNNITQQRVQEIANRFIESSIKNFTNQALNYLC